MLSEALKSNSTLITLNLEGDESGENMKKKMKKMGEQIMALMIQEQLK